MRLAKCICVGFLLLVGASFAGSGVSQPDEHELLKTREQVWRAWFADDQKSLHALVPVDTIVISGGEEKWKHQAEVLQSAEEFHASGGKLLHLEFPQTEVQHFGDVAIVWSTFALETETNGKTSSSTGRATEIFVRRQGHWVNPGWHTSKQ